jgi:hypothetical protein
MQITAFYRTFDGDNDKPRPSYYSKLRAFQSFLLSWTRIPDGKLIVAVNSPRVPPTLAALIDRYAHEVRFVKEQGNARCYQATLDWSLDLDDDSLVYHAEDDYLYHPDAFPSLVAAAEQIASADYFTLYDHNDRYQRTDDMHLGRREFVSIAGNRHWRVVESTCMTYAARVGALRRDAFLHRRLCADGMPRDRLLWRLTQGIGIFFWKLPKRTLISPVPSLATHLEPAFLAPVVDWSALAEQVTHDATRLDVRPL